MAVSLLQGKRFFCREWAFAKLAHSLDQRPAGKAAGVLIVGGAGSGKTALCCELAWPTSTSHGKQRSLHKHLLAHHFCQAQDVSTLAPADFIHHLVQQISCSDLLSGYADKLKDPEVVAALDYRECQREPDEALKKAVLFPLLELDPPKHGCFLLVDSIDETHLQNSSTLADRHGSSTGTSQTIAELLANCHHLLPHWLLLVCSARRESRAIARLFTGFRKISLDDLRKPQVVRDVQQYILLRLEQEECLRQHISRETAEMLNHLHIKSNGCILYLEKVLDGVSDSFIVLREVREIPGTLNGLYLWLCQRLFTRKQFHKVQPLLSILLAARKPLSEEQLVQCLWTRHTKAPPEEFERRLRLLRRVLVTAYDGTQLLFHNSFSEWLLDVKHCTQKYLCQVSDGHAMLALHMSRRATDLSPDEVHELAYHLTHMPARSLSPSNAVIWLLAVGTPLHDCLHHGCPSDAATLKLLYEAGARTPDALDSDDKEKPSNHQSQDEESEEADIESLSELDPTVKSPLERAAHEGDLQRVKHILNKYSWEKLELSAQMALVLSSRQGHAEIVSVLLEAGSNSDLSDLDGWTPLRSAAWGGHSQVVDILLSKGANVDLCDGEGRTALRAAAWGGHESVVSSLLREGATVDLADREGRTPLIAAAYMGHADIVQALLESGADVDHEDADGRTALSVAALCLPAAQGQGHDRVVSALLEKGAQVDHQDKEGMTPLLVAAFEGHREVCELLLECEADADHADVNQRTPLWAAASMGHDAVVELLLFWGCYVDSIDSEGRTVLSVAAAQGSPTVVKQLLDRGLDEMHRDNTGWTPLHYGAFEGHREVCELIVEGGARIDEPDNEGRTALVLAAQEGHAAVVGTLLQLGATVDARSHDGKSALRAAALNDHKDVVHLLLCHASQLDYCDADGRSTLYLLALENRTSMARFLLGYGAQVDCRDLEGRTALHVSSWQGHVEMVSLLLEAHAEVNATDKENRTALHSASWQGHDAVVQLLLERGATVDHPCNQGATALCIAAQEGHMECVQLLLRYGADPSRSDRCGRTAVRVAHRSGHESVARLLENFLPPSSTLASLSLPPTLTAPNYSTAASSAETKACSAVMCDEPPSPASTLADTKRRSIGNTSTSSNRTSSSQTSQIAPSRVALGEPQPLAPLAFTQQVQLCSRAKRRPTQTLSPLNEPLYASPPISPPTVNSPEHANSKVTEESMLCSRLAVSSIHSPFSVETGKGCGPGKEADSVSPLAFTRDSHMKIILGTRSPETASPPRRNGIVTNANLKLGLNLGLGLGLGFARRTPAANSGNSSPGGGHQKSSNGFAWKKETPL